MTETRTPYTVKGRTPLESLVTFDRRERRYPLPIIGTPEERVKAAAKSWRNPERFRLSCIGHDATSGRTPPDNLVYAQDVRRLFYALPEPYRTVCILSLFTARPPHPKGLTQAESDLCESCEQHFGNPQIARMLGLVDDRGRPDSRAVGQYRRHGVSRVAVTMHPEYYRGRKARAGI